MTGGLDAPSRPEALLRASCGRADRRGPPAERGGSPSMGRRRQLQVPGPRVATVSALLCFCILLCVTSGAADASLGPAQSGRAPVAHLQLQPRLKTLSWISGSPARGMGCRMDAPLQAPAACSPADAMAEPGGSGRPLRMASVRTAAHRRGFLSFGPGPGRPAQPALRAPFLLGWNPRPACLSLAQGAPPRIAHTGLRRRELTV
ncbi:uncharacterized protein LOC111814141 [Octodon degus]|uniref:Uncharacterized protein LOC111814141 n=1 Tax=Octodon degus TaxID=10160 RepID=A0A6P6DSJ1_OCTDE|nr:uncharacterized protein LOC111814141 [Octodon degus]